MTKKRKVEIELSKHCVGGFRMTKRYSYFNANMVGQLKRENKKLKDENEQLKTENTMLKEHQNINCQNCQYFVSDSVSSDCLKKEDIGYKGTCIDGMDLHMLAKNCPYY